MSATQVLDIDNPSFARRWLRSFLLERHAGITRAILLVMAILFYLYGPFWVIWLVAFLPVSQLGSSGASVASHLILQAIALLFCSTLLMHFLKPAAALLEINESGIRLLKRVLFITYSERFIPWEDIGRIRIQRPLGKTDLRSFSLCLLMANSAQRPLVIPLGNLEKEQTRECLVQALQRHAKHAIIEPGTLETLQPSRNLSFTEIWLDALSAAPGRERLTPIQLDTVLNERYRCVKRLGGGGQATAYLATDLLEPAQSVVLKETILPVYADLHTRRKSLEKFHEEAVALESVKNNGIVRYLNSFVEDHRAYLVLEHIEGTTLRTKIEKSGTLGENEALKYALAMCEILAVLHDKNPPLIHRDFTPDNLMLRADGALVLIDFAVAICTTEGSDEAAGKIAYMAPEQFKGTSTVQADIYSAGCTIHFTLTGQDPEPLSESHPQHIVKTLSAEIDRIIAKATCADPSNRYQSVLEMRKELLLLESKCTVS
jgi:serine/threonine-protein kinase